MKIITRDAAKAGRYLDYLRREIALQAPLFEGDKHVAQMHWGGGTPTYYGTDELRALFRTLRDSFDLAVLHTVLSHVTDPAAMLSEAFRVLRPGGTLVVCDGDFSKASLAVASGDPMQAFSAGPAPEATYAMHSSR